MDEVFDRLIRSAGVAEGDRNQVLRKLRALRKLHPRDTPARLLERARHEGAPIPPARCNHGVARGECVLCDPTIGARFYFTGGGTHVHSTPTCRALADGQEKVRRRGGSPDCIEVVPRYSGFIDARDPCRHCLPARPPALSTVDSTFPRRATRSALTRRQLTQTDPPEIGQRVSWGGYAGLVVEVGSEGVRIATGGCRIFIAWGEDVILVPGARS